MNKLRRAAWRIRAGITRRLPMDSKVWLSKLGHGEHDWQRTAKEKLDRVSLRRGLGRSTQPHNIIARGFNSADVTRDNLAALRDCLDSYAVDYVQLPTPGLYQPIIVIGRDQLTITVSALQELAQDHCWSVKYLNGRKKEVADLTKRASVRTIQVARPMFAANGRELTGESETIEIQLWMKLSGKTERVDGSFHVNGTLHRYDGQKKHFLEYLTPAAWAAAVSNGRIIKFSLPHIYDLQQPVDIVYTWVDGDDPKWQQRKAQAQGDFVAAEVNETALSAARFISRDELKYSLRSIEMYAGWVNHIYLVTDQQVPEWLDTQHPRITVVDHKDIFTHQEFLPVFNSHAIESQLHHITDLAEHYVYMNDDIFFCRPTDKDLFFAGNGVSYFYPSKANLDIDEPSRRDLPVLSAAKNNRKFLQQEFGVTVTNKFKHTPHAQIRSVMYELENKYPGLFDQVAKSQFRHPDDYSISSALYQYYAFTQKQAAVGRIKYGYMDIARPDGALYLQRMGRRNDLDVLCLNDTNSNPEQQESLSRLLRSFLEEHFPVPSSFEKH